MLTSKVDAGAAAFPSLHELANYSVVIQVFGCHLYTAVNL